MRDRSEQILRYTSAVLAALGLAYLLAAGCRAGALVGARIPAIPTLETNAVSTTNAPAAVKGTNGPALARGTNASASTITNAPASGTNRVAAKTPVLGSTNIAQLEATNSPERSVPATNVASLLLPQASSSSSSSSSSNSLTSETNLVSTNLSALANTNAAGTTNAVKKSKKRPSLGMTGGLEPGGFPGGFPGMPGQAPKLPPEIQARVDKIVESELFAPIMHPQPMALLGIAGDTAFLRTASGQTGLVKEGEPLGELKLLRIGINRVLVEQDGQKKELMMFDGYGGESLLPKDSKDISK